MNSQTELISLTDEVYVKALKEVIENQLRKPFENFEIIVTVGSKKGDGFAGLVYRIQVIEKSTKEMKLSLILKTPPENKARRDMFTDEIFIREGDFYDKVFPMYQKFQAEKGIDIKNEGFHHAPMCYKVTSEKEGLFLEDLKIYGYDLHDRCYVVEKEHVLLVIKSLAKMHAVFYSLNDQKPELTKPFLRIPEIFLIILKNKINPMGPWFEKLKEQTLEVVNKSGNADLIEKIQKLLKSSLYELLKDVFDHDKLGVYGTLCHGDCWNNNMLFLFNEKKIPVDIRYLDFQILRHASPVVDLVYYIFCSTDKALRDKYYQEFLNVYYNELSMTIKRLGSNPQILYPREIFDKHLKLYGHFGFIMAMIALPHMTSDKDDIPDIQELAENMKKMEETGETIEGTFDFIKAKNVDKYTERMLGVCNDMYRLGYI